MSEGAKPEVKEPSGVFIPTAVLVALGLAFGGLVATYVFTTKVEFLGYTQEAGRRVTVVEETVKHHDKAIERLDRTTQAIDQNVRTLMTEQGVPADKIAVPQEKP
jgi:hypothetical protein